jgi:hypothetical protein
MGSHKLFPWANLTLQTQTIGFVFLVMPGLILHHYPGPNVFHSNLTTIGSWLTYEFSRSTRWESITVIKMICIITRLPLHPQKGAIDTDTGLLIGKWPFHAYSDEQSYSLPLVSLCSSHHSHLCRVLQDLIVACRADSQQGGWPSSWTQQCPPSHNLVSFLCGPRPLGRAALTSWNLD